MDADTVLTTPLTVTGSIGVILGWFWDEGFSEKTGFTADGVQRGEHADLFTGIRPPFLPLPRPLPERNLTPDEQEEAKRLIAEEYDTFVAGVARGRGLSEERVRELGEGRIWMGEDALERDLVDGLGGLGDAVALVRELAGIDDDQEVRTLEWPERPLFTWPRFFPDLPGIRSLAWSLFGSTPAYEEEDSPGYEWIYTRALAEGAGHPQALLPPDQLPAEWWTAP
jgi:protease-4